MSIRCLRCGEPLEPEKEKALMKMKGTLPPYYYTIRNTKLPF
jgi:hypothetical protein